MNVNAASREKKRTVRVEILLTPEEFRSYSELAAAAGLALGPWIRMAANELRKRRGTR